jgi:hypothetical protein
MAAGAATVGRGRLAVFFFVAIAARSTRFVLPLDASRPPPALVWRKRACFRGVCASGVRAYDLWGMTHRAIEAVQGQIVGAAHAGLAKHTVSPTRKKIAIAIAALADLIQLGFFPAFAEGALSIPDDVLDVVVAIALFITLGFHWRIFAALLVEIVPGVALFPSWTAVAASVQTTEIER